ncbi:MAG TPA: tetratricopeptide repeat protein [Tepidisphaeraceae bacterium]|nr:tetratricopeptide repeat protein [Tepidisphaeraceae bacterium]
MTRGALALALALPVWAQEAAPDPVFEKLAGHVAKDAPSQDLVDRVYEFMEKYPKDPRSDRLQYWVGVTQQRRKFHNEAIKELGFVVSDFPKSPLLLPALRGQAESYLATGQKDAAADCYVKIVERQPAALLPDQAAAVREALMFLAAQALDAKDVDGAVGHCLKLPDRTEAITRVVELYIRADRHEDALGAIAKLDEEDRFLAYRLTAVTYGSRPGVANLMKLLGRVIEKEKPAGRTDQAVEMVVKTIARKGEAEHVKALELVAAKYERLKRWAQFALCEIFKATDPVRLRTFVGDWRTGGDVEKVKTYLGAYFEAAGDVPKAQEAYRLLEDKVAAHFLVAETYYGQRARTKDLVAGQAELSAIVKRFYSPVTSADALTRRAELEAGPMGKPEVAIRTLIELMDRFPSDGSFAQAAHMRLGTLYRNARKYDEAIAVYERLILQYPDGKLLRQAWLAIAMTHEEKGDPKRAIEVLRMVLRKFPHTGEASQAHTRLEQKYKVPDTEVGDR